ncbi:MAG: helix-hairpin-helix domain-containing protein [Bacteroidota bacterium]|nr:helix-hairpin-helix domain-containing protein [Bacteroidota bacterium]
MKQIIKDYFTFSAKERRAVFVLVFFIIVCLLLPYFYPGSKKTSTISVSTLPIAQGNTKHEDSSALFSAEEMMSSEASDRNASELFEFDPNVLDAAGWKRLGLRDKTVRTILNYTAKGGRFRQAEDIRKIWGLRPEEANRLIPFIRIGDKQEAGPDFHKKNANKTISLIDINSAPAEQWILLPGMDWGIANRIIRYRDKLGGFHTVEQVKETYGLSDSLFSAIQAYLSVSSSTLKKININIASEYELALHPYISKDIAKAIIIYRTQHGAYGAVADIRKIVFITAETFQKIAPYLTV